MKGNSQTHGLDAPFGQGDSVRCELTEGYPAESAAGMIDGLMVEISPTQPESNKGSTCQHTAGETEFVPALGPQSVPVQ